MPLTRILFVRPRTKRALALAGAACFAPVAIAADAVGPATGQAPSGYRAIEQQANIFTQNRQQDPSVAIDAEGNVLVAWGSRRQESATFGIFARLFDPAGQPIGGEIHLNQYLPNAQETPAIAFAPDGRVWCVWRSHEQDGDQGGIVARRFGFVDNQLTALTDEFIVNQTTKGDQTQPTIAVGDDRALVVWTSPCNGRQQVVGRLFDAAGAPLTDEFRLGEATVDHDMHEWIPNVAAQPGNAFVTVWSTRPAGDGHFRLQGRLVTADGVRGDVLDLPGDAKLDVEPSLASAADGRFVVAWMRGAADGSGYNVVAQRFAADGSTDGTPHRVASAANGWKSGVAVTVAPDGRYAVAYNTEGDSSASGQSQAGGTPSSVMVRRYESNGRSIGAPYRINQYDDGRQMLPIGSNAARMAWSDKGQLAVVWNGRTEHDGRSVALSMLVPETPTDAGRQASGSSTGLSIDGALAALANYDDAVTAANAKVPPDWDPNHVPEDPEEIILAPGQDFGFIGFTSTGWNPPDPDLAVGPNHIVVAVNMDLRFYTKAGELTFSQALVGGNGFWGEQGAENFVFDPVLLYDKSINRYIIVATEHRDSNRSYLNFGVSDDDDPNGTWHKYSYNLISVGGFIDFPNLGVGPEAIYVATDFFNNPEGNQVHMVDKMRMADGLSTSITSVRFSNGFRSTAAVNTYDQDAPAQYFASSHSGPTNQIALDAIIDPLGSPIRTSYSLSVPSYSNPPDAQQRGSSNRVATVGRRIKNGVYRNGSLWLCHTIGQNSTARTRWYEIEMNGWPTSGDNPTLEQVQTLNLGGGVHNWFSDINVDAGGNMAIAFNQSSVDDYVSVERTFRMATDPLNTLRTPQQMQISTAPETGSRWGDYAGLEEDPANPSVFWSHHEYRTTSWRTWVGRFDILEGLDLLSFTYPDGLPDEIDANGGTTFLVEVQGNDAVPAPDTGTLHYNDGASYQEVPMNYLGNDTYEAEFPKVPCDTQIDFYVSVETTSERVVTDPAGAPNDAYSAPSVCGDACPWDLDDDGEVGFGDLVQLLSVWGKCEDCPEDFDDNGFVGFNDLLLLLVEWGPCK